MIQGFETETAPLTEQERGLLPLMERGLKAHVGKANAVTNKAMRAGLKRMGHIVSDARVRKLLNHIRNNALVPRLLANSNGYWVSNDPAEVREYAASLKGREDAIRSIRLRVLEQANEIDQQAA